MKGIGLLTGMIMMASFIFGQDMVGVKGIGKMKDGHKVGKWSYICELTSVEVGKENYDGDGLKDGYQTWQDCDGNLLSEYNYEHGKKIGVQKEYYPHDRRLKREWSMMELPKKCRKTDADKEATAIDYYHSFYESGKREVVWEGNPCGERSIIKYREASGTHWTIEYDIDGNYKHGPREEERAIDSEELR